ncbi:hypothetical protein [Vibrio rotiferianus]|uniref:hypothetical protein n=1 Tax=Vibrio rotiferianus TaxID=190895 RepID=UPI0005EE9BEB|nr:hypothetical protein [Vibrio rotiferianus]
MTTFAINAKSPLAILDFGLVTPLATGWQESCAAMKAGYDAFVYPEGSRYPIAEVPFNESIRGYKRLAHLLNLARQDLTKQYDAMPVLCALPDPKRATLLDTASTKKKIFDEIAKIPEFQGKFHRDYLECFDQGRTSFVNQLERAQEILHTTNHDRVMLMAVDSLLFPQTINTLLADCWNSDPILDKCRILTRGNGNDNVDGFIPAEAAAIIVVGKAEKHDSPYIIDGTAIASEPIPILDARVSKGEGLTTAIREACTAAGGTLNDYPARIADISGEQYFFREASLAQTRNLKTKVEHQPLLLPASNVGETGAVVGPIIMAMAIDSFMHDEKFGEKVLCHLSNDEHDRAAFSLRHRHIGSEAT